VVVVRLDTCVPSASHRVTLIHVMRRVRVTGGAGA
jgi:hypothetical protein